MKSNRSGALNKAAEGFWLPQGVRKQLLSNDTKWESLSFSEGRSCEATEPTAITARWPKFTTDHLQSLLHSLDANRRSAPRGEAFWSRFLEAIEQVGQRLGDLSDPLRSQMLTTLPSYTGFSEPMIRFTLDMLELMSLDQLGSAYAVSPTSQTIQQWQPMVGVPGHIRFYPTDARQRVFRHLLRLGDLNLFNQAAYPDLILGYGAGNVPGTALLIILLALAATLTGNAPPIVIVKNSRREPIFTPLILSGLEAVAPELVSTVAILIWEYEDAAVRSSLLPQADLVIAAASDESIADIQSQLDQTSRDQGRFRTSRYRTGRASFHAHGHKVSFSAIGKEMLSKGLTDPESGRSLIEIITLLAALDSAFWDQFGCLSSRFHFVERGGDYSPQAYADQLVGQFRLLSEFLPRGAWPKRQLRDTFDLHKMLEATGLVQVFSRYEDDFVVTLDERHLSASSFFSMVNSCQGRVVIVRPVDDLMLIPDQYLQMLPAENLQSLSVAIGQDHEGMSARLLQFAEACADRGVTAIRTVGRGAFPQLSYSWDGFIPLDLVRRRPAGRFSTIEFDHPYQQILETYHLLLQRGAAFGFTLS